MKNKIFPTSYEKVKVSILASSKDSLDFEKFCKSLLETCSHPENVEIIVKIDSIKDVTYEKILENCSFKYKIISYPFYERHSSHHFYNDMFCVSSGIIIWPLGTDCRVIHGDWYKSLIRTRNSYKDNIYYVFTYMDTNKKKRGIAGAPAVTREWCSVLGLLSLTPNIDRWLYAIGKEINRVVVIPHKELLIHYPKGSRVMTKIERKRIFFPMIEKVCKKFKKAVK